MQPDLSNISQIIKQLDGPRANLVLRALRQKHPKVAYLFVKAVFEAKPELRYKATDWVDGRARRKHVLRAIVNWYSSANLECRHRIEDGKSPIEDFFKKAQLLLKD